MVKDVPFRLYVCRECDGDKLPCYIISKDDKPRCCPYGFGWDHWEELKPQEFVRQIARSLNGR